MEELGFRLNVEEGNSAKTVGNFKKELREAKAEAVSAARSFGEFSPQAIDAAKKFAALNDTLKDTNELASVLAGPDKFRAFANLAGGLAGGFSAVQGAIGLVGDESKDLEKALLKVNSAVALSNGLTQFADLGKYIGQARAALFSFEAVQKINNATTAAAAKVQKLFTGEVAATSTGFKVLKGAIAATGIGLLVVIIGEVVANFDKLKKAVFNLIPGLETLTEFFGDLIEKATDFIGLTSEAEREEERLRGKISETNEESDRALQLAQASGATSKEVRALKNQQYDDELSKLKEIQALSGGSEEDIKRLKELEFQKKLLSAEATKEENDRIDKANEERARKNKEFEAKRKKEEEDRKAKEFEQIGNDLRERFELEKEIEDEARKKKEQEDILLRGKGTEKGLGADFQRAAEELRARGEAQAAVLEEVAQQGEDRELQLLERKYEKLRSAAQGNEMLLTAITESEAQARAEVVKKFDDLELQRKQEQQAKLAGILNQASQLFGKNTAAGKVTAIAGATVDTYRGATAALAASAGAGPFGVALGIAQAAIVVAAGLKNIKQIIATKVPGGDGAPSSVASASAGSTAPALSGAPTLQGVQSTLIDATKKLSENQNNRRAYVVESEVTEKQERARAIQQSASF
jgi:hypothetical protein